MTRAILGLGSNLGDRQSQLRQAVEAIPNRVAVSSVYQTAPVGGPDDQGAFLNMVVVVDTAATPRQLLELARRLETAASRVREEHWGPRTLDVDVLWVDGHQVDDPDLVVPHPRMLQRRFVQVPLLEVAPDLEGLDWDVDPTDVVELVGAEL